MTFPSPFPTPKLMPFEVDLDKFFSDVSGHIQWSRRRRGQPSLSPNGEVLVGQEHVAEEHSAPRIVVVPIGVSFTSARHIRDALDPVMLRSQWIDCEAHCWGDPDPQQVSTVYGFNTALELWRQLYAAMVYINRGQPNIRDDSAQWVQRTDVNRQGRVLNVSFGIWSALTTDPPVTVPVQTATTPGVTASIVAQLVTADGSSTVQEAVFTAPP